MPSYGISIDTSSIRKAIVGLSVEAPKRFKTRINRAINETLDYTEIQIMKLIPEKYSISAGRLRSSAGFGFQRQRASEGAMGLPVAWGGTGGAAAGDLILRSRRLPVAKFQFNPVTVPNQKGIPVSARAKVSFSTIRGKTSSGLPNRFVAQMASGHIGIFRRKPGSTKRRRPDGQWTQLPISEAFMLSASEMISGKRIRPILERRMQAFFLKKLNEGLQRPII